MKKTILFFMIISLWSIEINLEIPKQKHKIELTIENMSDSRWSNFDGAQSCYYPCELGA